MRVLKQKTQNHKTKQQKTPNPTQTNSHKKILEDKSNIRKSHHISSICRQ